MIFILNILLLFSATITSGDEDIGGDGDYLGCSYKTVIHRPTPQFYLSTKSNLVQQAPPAQPPPPQTPATLMAPAQAIGLTPPPLIPVPVPPVVVLPSPPVNSPMHYRAHTDTDLLYYQQQAPSFFHPTNWYPPMSPVFIYGPPPTLLHPHPAPFIMHQIPCRSSSADCRRTANNINETHVIHPERVR